MVFRKEITERIRDLLKQHPQGLNITEIVRVIGINRNTAGRYLENLMVSGQVEMRHFGMAKIYRLAQRVPLSAMLSISSELIMLLDGGQRVIYANEPLQKFLGCAQKDLYGKNIEYTPCVTVFDEAFETLKRKIKAGLAGTEWSGELSLKNNEIIFFCRVAPSVFEEGQRGVSVLFEDISERKRTEQKIKDRELQFRLLAENSMDMIDRHTPDGTCIYVSPACKTILGYKPRELIGHSAQEVLHPDDAYIVAKYRAELTRKNPSAKATYRARHKDGHIIWLQSSIRAIFDEKTGEFIEIYGVTRDITDQKKAEEALRESEDRYRKLVEISPDAVILHCDGKIRYMNKAALGLIGASSPDQVIGKNILDIVHPGFREAVRSSIEKDLAGDLTPPLELPLIRLDGTCVLVEGSGVRTLIAGSPAVLVAMRDITGRKRAEEALRESEGKLSAMLQSISDPMSMMDEDLTIIWANEAAKQYFGNNITGRKCYDVYHQRAEPCEPYPCLTLKAFHDGKMHRHETKVIDKGGEERFFECTANVALRDQSGKPVAVLEISRDITKRKKAEYALIESEATARALINAPTDSILLLDTQGVILDLNETAVQKLGKRREDLIGTCADDALPGDVAKARRARISRVIETKKPVRFVDERDGFWFDTVAYPIKNEHGEVVRLAVIARDINDLMQAEETLRETVSAFRMLAENSPDIIVRMAPDGTCHYISPAVSAILGYRPEEITGTSVFRYLHPDDLEHIRETIADFNRNSRETSTDTFRIRHQHGHYVRFETTTRAIRDPVTGKVKEFYTVSRDISARTGT